MSSNPSPGGFGLQAAVIPLAVLCSGLVVGGIAAFFITRKIGKMRIERQILLAQQELEAEEEFMGHKPILMDIYLGPSTKPQPTVAVADEPATRRHSHVYHSSWSNLQVRHIQILTHYRRLY